MLYYITSYLHEHPTWLQYMSTRSVTMLEFTFNAATAVVMTLSFISIMAPQVSKRNDELIIIVFNVWYPKIYRERTSI